MNIVKSTLSVMLIAVMTGCASLQNLGEQVRAKAEPVAVQGQHLALKAEAYAINANNIAERIAKGEQVSEDEKKALADFTLALEVTATDLRQVFDYLLLGIRLLPEPKK